MRDEARRFDALVERYMKLGGADRRAVLARLAPSERDLFEREVAAALDLHRREREQARLADRQFVGYSPWLAAIIGKAAKGAHDADPARTIACDKAIVLAHRSASEPAAEDGPLGRLLRQLGLRGPTTGEGAR